MNKEQKEIKKIINIKLLNYNLEEATIEVVKKLIEDEPNLSKKEYAKRLGCSERTLIRWAIKYNLKVFFDNRGRKITHLSKIISLLEESGYEVKKIK